jgi:Skp family chaperone for outer membrane proteins
VGQAATARLRDLAQEAQSVLEAEKAHLEARGKALQEKRPTLTDAQFQTQALSIQRRAQTLQTDVADRSRQIDATRSPPMARS